MRSWIWIKSLRKVHGFYTVISIQFRLMIVWAVSLLLRRMSDVDVHGLGLTSLSFSLTTFATPNSSSNSMPVYHRLRIWLNRYPTKSMVDVHEDLRKWSIIWRRSSDGPRCANRTPSFNICLWNPGMTLSKRSSSCLRTKHLAFAISTPAEWEIFEFHWMSSTNLSLRHGFYLDLKRHRQLSS